MQYTIKRTIRNKVHKKMDNKQYTKQKKWTRSHKVCNDMEGILFDFWMDRLTAN